jgi:glutamyl-tRNA synthetase
MNGVYIREMTDDAFVSVAAPLVEAGLGRGLTDDERGAFLKLVPLIKERTKLLSEIADQAMFLFEAPATYDEAAWTKVMETPEAPVALEGAANALSSIDEWTTESVDASLRGMLADHELSARKGLQPIRVAISGSTVSPPLFESIELLGRSESIERIERAKQLLT